LTSPAAGTITFALLVNGVASGVTCAIASSGSACLDSTHTVTLAAGDVIAVSVTNSSGLLRHVRWSARLATT
jgi:hypothetical protein